MSMSIATKAIATEADRISGRKSREARAPRRAEKAFALGGKARVIPVPTRRELFRAVLFVVSGLLALTAFGLSARAGGTRVMIIPTDDGYGLSDCLTENASCGPIVASAWCKAQGHGASGTFGPVAAGVTASDAPPAANGARGFAITCQE